MSPHQMLDYSRASTRYMLTVLASNREGFASFEPYVPAINNLGQVAFHATSSDGSNGVFVTKPDGSAPMPLPNASDIQVTSHPDIDNDGATCFYAKLSGGETALVRHSHGRQEVLASIAEGFSAIGPLGPTVGEGGSIAFRGDLESGSSAIGLYTPKGTRVMAETGGDIACFQGLPVAAGSDSVVFRADMADGRQIVCISNEGSVSTLCSTGTQLSVLGNFPCSTPNGTVGVVGRTAEGMAALCRWNETVGLTILISDEFESFRGILADDTGTIAHYGTPKGATLGVYVGPDSVTDRLIGLGDTFLDSKVVDFALNPVSVNANRQLALRVRLQDGTQSILRADPACP